MDSSATTTTFVPIPNNSWSKWLTKFEEKHKNINDENIKILKLLDLAGDKIKKIYQTSKSETDTYIDVVKKISNYYQPYNNDDNNSTYFPKIVKSKTTENLFTYRNAQANYAESYSTVKHFIQNTIQKLPSKSDHKPVEKEFENYIYSLPQNDDRPIVQIQLLNTSVNMLIDSGATINIIDMATFVKLKPQPLLEPSKTKVFTYSSRIPLHTLGQFTCNLSSKIKTVETLFHVVPGNSGCVLKYKTCKELGLIHINHHMDVNDEQYIKQIKNNSNEIAPTILLFKRASTFRASKPKDDKTRLNKSSQDLKKENIETSFSNDNIQLGDSVLMRQLRKDSKRLVYNQFPYKVVKINDDMITAEGSDNKITKNVKYFKKLHTFKPISQINFNWGFDNKFVLPAHEENVEKNKRFKNYFYSSLPLN
jgi:hypothetical protein